MNSGHAARSMASSVCSAPGIPAIDPAHSNYVMKILRKYAESRGWYEVLLQHWLDRLSACEDPKTVAKVKFCGETFSMPQTCQMRQEQVLLGMKKPQGMYHLTYSYRAEPKIGERRKRAFPLFEFEVPAKKNGYLELIQTCKEMLQALGFTQFHTISYQTACKRYGVSRITDKEEALLEKDFGQVVFLVYFPIDETFFNMKHDPSQPGYAFKLDVIVGGQETIGSAERAVSVEEMRKEFYASSNGEYYKKLCEEFGKENVDREFENYLLFIFIARYGGGIGLTRLIQAMLKYGLLPEPAMRATK